MREACSQRAMLGLQKGMIKAVRHILPRFFQEVTRIRSGNVIGHAYRLRSQGDGRRGSRCHVASGSAASVLSDGVPTDKESSSPGRPATRAGRYRYDKAPTEKLREAEGSKLDETGDSAARTPASGDRDARQLRTELRCILVCRPSAQRVACKMHQINLMSVPENRGVVGMVDGINPRRDPPHLRRAAARARR